jgi:hypothetical protein
MFTNGEEVADKRNAPELWSILVSARSKLSSVIANVMRLRLLALTPKFKLAFRKFVKRNADLQTYIED